MTITERVRAEADRAEFLKEAIRVIAGTIRRERTASRGSSRCRCTTPRTSRRSIAERRAPCDHAADVARLLLGHYAVPEDVAVRVGPLLAGKHIAVTSFLRWRVLFSHDLAVWERPPL